MIKLSYFVLNAEATDLNRVAIILDHQYEHSEVHFVVFVSVLGMDSLTNNHSYPYLSFVAIASTVHSGIRMKINLTSSKRDCCFQNPIITFIQSS